MAAQEQPVQIGGEVVSRRQVPRAPARHGHEDYQQPIARQENNRGENMGERLALDEKEGAGEVAERYPLQHPHDAEDPVIRHAHGGHDQTQQENQAGAAHGLAKDLPARLAAVLPPAQGDGQRSAHDDQEAREHQVRESPAIPSRVPQLRIGMLIARGVTRIIPTMVRPRKTSREYSRRGRSSKPLPPRLQSYGTSSRRPDCSMVPMPVSIPGPRPKVLPRPGSSGPSLHPPSGYPSLMDIRRAAVGLALLLISWSASMARAEDDKRARFASEKLRRSCRARSATPPISRTSWKARTACRKAPPCPRPARPESAGQAAINRSLLSPARPSYRPARVVVPAAPLFVDHTPLPVSDNLPKLPLTGLALGALAVVAVFALSQKREFAAAPSAGVIPGRTPCRGPEHGHAGFGRHGRSFIHRDPGRPPAPGPHRGPAGALRRYLRCLSHLAGHLPERTAAHRALGRQPGEGHGQGLVRGMARRSGQRGRRGRGPAQDQAGPRVLIAACRCRGL